ncbi:MAG: polyhydroxyalkanoate synthesis repressor PhaR [Pseudomonadota bacterium]
MTDTPPSTGKKKKSADDAIVIKKYANRRLYNTATSSYVTLDYLSEMVKNGDNFVVFDAKSGEDITRSVLTQIIFEEESKGRNLLPIEFLRQLIKFYGDSLENFLPSYLEMSMDAFSSNQEKIRARMRDTFGAAPGYAMFEESVRKNMDMFQQAMQMFSPLGAGYGPGAQGGASENGAAEPAPAPSEDIDALKSQLAALQKQLDNLEKKSG